jgi:hypothetical protein
MVTPGRTFLCSRFYFSIKPTLHGGIRFVGKWIKPNWYRIGLWCLLSVESREPLAQRLLRPVKAESAIIARKRLFSPTRLTAISDVVLTVGTQYAGIHFGVKRTQTDDVGRI